LFLINRNAYKLYVRATHYLAFAEKIEFGNNQRGELRKDIQLVKIREGQLMKLENLNFEQGDFKILEESYEELELLVNLLRQNESMVIQLEGHTDYRGNRKLNFTLSENRVNAVRDFLVARGISKKRIKTKAFGGSHPLSYEDDEEARKVNRRVEVRILNLQSL
jgi:outer membrane protein OmpA-like peptidoglycan-associated protein